MKSKLKIIFAMIVFGTIGLLVKNINISSGEIAFFRAIIATIVILIYKTFTKKRLDLKEIKKDIPILFISGIAMGGNWILLFEAYNYTTISMATLSYYFAPVIVMVVCPIIFKERLTLKQIICFLMSTIGLVLVIGVSGISSGRSNLIGIAFGICAAVLYATVIILNKFIKKVTGIDRTLIQFIAAIIVLIPYLALTSGINLGSLDNKGIINLIILGVVHTGIAYCLYFESLKNLKGQEAAILSYIDPLVAIILSVSILNESITTLQLVGGVLILGFTLLNEIKIRSKYI